MIIEKKFFFKTINKHDYIVNLVFFIETWIAFLKMAVPEGLHDIVATLGVIVGVLLWGLLILKYKISKKVYGIFLCIVVLGLINIIFVNNLYYSVFCSIIFSYFPISLCVVYSKNNSLMIWKISYAIVAAYLAYRVVTSPDGSAMLFYNLSRNNLSVILLGWLVIVAVMCYKQGKELPIWTIIVYVFACILAVGRMGIFVALLIGGLYFFYYFFLIGFMGENSKQKKIFGIIACLIIMLCIFSSFLLFDNSKIYIKFFSRYSEVGMNGASDRLGMVCDYAYSLNSFKKIILGIPKMEIHSIAERLGNPHNSYVYMHMFFGIGGFVFLILAILKMALFYLKNKAYVLLILLMGFSIRIVSDSVFPASFGGDISFWVLFFYMLLIDENIRTKNTINGCRR